jgi:class 3 adenylate cyclase
MLMDLDVRHVLPSIRVPTLLIHRIENRLVHVEHGRYLAAHITSARLVEIPGSDYFLWLGSTDVVLEEIRAFLGASPEAEDHDRMLTTILFVDIAGSTEKLAELGDRAWRTLLSAFLAAVRFELTRFRGREIDTAGDGFFASFDGPARAIRCATAIVDATRALGIEVRAGLHTGEVESIGEKVSGLAVHIGARVAGVAAPSEVLVSSTVRDLVAGSGITFQDRGEHTLKGVPEDWRLYRAIPPGPNT